MDQVRLVSHQYDGGFDGAPHAVDQLLEVASLLETAAVRDGVWNDETFTRSHVLITHGCELRLVSDKEIFFTNSLSCILVRIMQNYGIYQINMVMTERKWYLIYIVNNDMLWTFLLDMDWSNSLWHSRNKGN